MPELNWEEFSEIKHSVSQVRTIVCSTWLRLEQLKIHFKWKQDTIDRLKKLDKRLEVFEDYLVMIFHKYQVEKQ